MLEGYFPDVTPKRDGSHLLTYWDMCRDLFASFPWNSGKFSDQLRMDLPPATVIQDVMNRYLQAGTDYTKAYKTAFYIENRDHMNGLDVPTVMMRWEGSPVVSMADNLIEQGLPQCVDFLHAGLPIRERYSVQKMKLHSVVKNLPLQKVESLLCTTLASTAWQRTYFISEFGQIHAYRNDESNGTPMVVLHGAGASAKQMLQFVTASSNNRPILVFDLPDHGASFKLPDESGFTLSQLADPIISVLKKNGFTSMDLLVQGLGGAVAEYASEHLKIDRVEIANSSLHQAEDKHQMLSHGFPDLTPKIDGTHLVKAWSWVRDSTRYNPWFDRSANALRLQDADLSPSKLHEQTVDILRTGSNWHKLKTLELQLS